MLADGAMPLGVSVTFLLEPRIGWRCCFASSKMRSATLFTTHSLPASRALVVLELVLQVFVASTASLPLPVYLGQCRGHLPQSFSLPEARWACMRRPRMRCRPRHRCALACTGARVSLAAEGAGGYSVAFGRLGVRLKLKQIGLVGFQTDLQTSIPKH